MKAVPTSLFGPFLSVKDNDRIEKILRRTNAFLLNTSDKCKRATYLKQETSHNQECLGIATNTQTATDNQATETIAIAILDTFWFPRYKNNGS